MRARNGVARTRRRPAVSTVLQRLEPAGGRHPRGHGNRRGAPAVHPSLPSARAVASTRTTTRSPAASCWGGRTRSARSTATTSSTGAPINGTSARGSIRRWASGTIAMGKKVFGMTPFGWRFMSASRGPSPSWWRWRRALVRQPLDVPRRAPHGGREPQRRDVAVGLLDVHLEFWVVAGSSPLLAGRSMIAGRPRAGGRTEADRTAGRRRRSGGPGGSPQFRAGAGVLRCSRPWGPPPRGDRGGFWLESGPGAMGHHRRADPVRSWETTRRRRQGVVSLGRALARAIRQESFGLFVAFVLLPIAVYIDRVPAVVQPFRMEPEGLVGGPDRHARVPPEPADYGAGRRDEHVHADAPYYSRPWTWLSCCGPSTSTRVTRRDIAQVLAIGIPAIFWASLWAIPFVAVMWRRRRDWRAGFIVLPFLAQFLPWFAVTRPQFFFYVAPSPVHGAGHRLRRDR